MQKLKLKHNKKRNTAFLFESLTKELTKAIVNKDEATKQVILSIMKEHFKKGSILAKELDVYKSLYETRGLKKETADSRCILTSSTTFCSSSLKLRGL